MIIFKDRTEAGQKLAEDPVIKRNISKKAIILGIPRGGVEVGFPIAERCGCLLEPISLRKLPLPENDQVGFGAVTLDRKVILNDELVNSSFLSGADIEQITDEVYEEVLRRDKIYRDSRPFPNLENHTVLIVDDGLATGYTMLAAVKYCREKRAKKIVVAVPVAHAESFELVKKAVDGIVCLHVSKGQKFAVASFYEFFPDMEDSEVIEILKKSRAAIKSS